MRGQSILISYWMCIIHLALTAFTLLTKLSFARDVSSKCYTVIVYITSLHY